VDFTAVVEPKDVKVLAYSGEGILTLVTGYPSYFVGRAPKESTTLAHGIAK